MMSYQRPSVSGVRRPAAGISLRPGRLARLRAEKLWDRETLARESGLSVSTVTKYENAERRPRIDTLAALCRALGCDPEDLIAA